MTGKKRVFLLVLIILAVACSKGQPNTSEPSQTSAKFPSSKETSGPGTQIPATSMAQLQPSIISATQTSQKQADITPTIHRENTPSVKKTPTINPVLIGVYKQYINDEFGFSFEYPAAYDVEPYTICGLVPRKNVNDDMGQPYQFFMNIGFRGEFGILENGFSSLGEFVDQWIQRKETSGSWILSTRINREINGSQATTIEYRFGGRGGYATSTFFGLSDQVYIFNISAGAFCDFPEVGLNEFDDFNHAIETFKFIPLVP